MFTNPTDPAYNSDFQTVEFAINRRFAGRWMLLTSFGYSWLDQFHATTTGTGALDALAQGRVYNWRPSQRLFGDEGKETSTLWNYKAVGRYTLPYEIGFSGSWKVQSGRQYGRNTSVAFPGDGTQTVRVEPVTANRAPTVQILDFRVDKGFTFGRYGKLTAMVDIFNATNSGNGHELCDHDRNGLQARDRHSRSPDRSIRRAFRPSSERGPAPFCWRFAAGAPSVSAFFGNTPHSLAFPPRGSTIRPI